METVICGRCKKERELKKFRPGELKRGGAGCWCNNCLLKYHQKWKKGLKNVNSARCKKCGLDKPLDRWHIEGSKKDVLLSRYWCSDCKENYKQYILYDSVAKRHHYLPLSFRHNLAERLSKYEAFSVDDKGFVQEICCHCNKTYNVIVGSAISRLIKYEQNELPEQGKLNEQTFCSKQCRLGFETVKTGKVKEKPQHQSKIRVSKQRQPLVVPEIIIKKTKSIRALSTNPRNSLLRKKTEAGITETALPSAI